MYTIDANIFARDADPNDPHHMICRDLLAMLDRRQIPIFMPNLVLAEVAATVSRTRRDPIRAHLTVDALRAFAHMHVVVIDDRLATAAAEIAADRAIRGADARYVAIAQAYQCTLVSLDREQRERAVTVVAVQTPAEAYDVLNTGAR